MSIQEKSEVGTIIVNNLEKREPNYILEAAFVNDQMNNEMKEQTAEDTGSYKSQNAEVEAVNQNEINDINEIQEVIMSQHTPASSIPTTVV